MRLSASLIAATCNILLFAAVVPHADAFDLTGHWTGKWICKGFDGAKFTDPNKTATLDITQSGATFKAALDTEFQFTGATIPDAKKPDTQGESVLIECNTNLTFETNDGDSEIMRAKVKTKANSPKASFSATSVLENDVAPFGEEIQTCKYSFKRIDTTDPVVSACPP